MKKELPILDVSQLRVSFSAISTYLKCGKQYEFAYIKKQKSIPGIALLEGSAHHASFEMNNLHKKKTCKDLKAGALTDKFMEELREKVKVEERMDWGVDNEDGLFRRARSWHEKYINDLAPKIRPDLVEEKFEMPLEVDGVKFLMVCVVDLTYNKQVADYKTTSEYGFRNKKQDINNDLQLTFYTLPTKLKQVEQICLIKKANPDVQIISSTRTKAQLNWALQIAKNVVIGIQKQSFPMCDPTSWCCNPRLCGYYSQCRGAIEK